MPTHYLQSLGVDPHLGHDHFFFVVAAGHTFLARCRYLNEPRVTSLVVIRESTLLFGRRIS